MLTAPLPQAIPYDPVFEEVDADEAETIASLIESLHKISTITYEDSGHATRAVHAKSHALLRGELQVSADLPPEYAQGLFSGAGRYPVVLRLSTSPGDILDDKVSTPRGLAFKVLNVTGPRLPGAEPMPTQDFLMVNGPAFLTPDAKRFAANLKLLAATTDKAEGAKKILSAALRGLESLVEAVGGESATLKSLGGHPLTNPLGETYFTQVPFRHGRYMAKYSIAPSSPALMALTDAAVDLDDEPDGLRRAISAFFAAQGGEWEVRAQLCADLDTMPIEDASVVWPDDISPHVVVGRIMVAAHPPVADADITAAEDGLFFSPWNALEAHRPLGSVNRARQRAYESSGAFRAERDGMAFGSQGVGGCPVRHG